ncbi:MAG TPA: S8 family serine peptidase [Thermoanaerobaculia bacterium]
MSTKCVLSVLFLSAALTSTVHGGVPSNSPASPPGGPPPERSIQRTPNAIPGEYIVVLKEGVTRGPRDRDTGKPSVPEVARELAAAFNGTLLHTYQYALRGFSIRMPEERARNLARHPKVEMVEENGEVHATATQYYPPWGLDRIDQRYLPLDSTFTYHTTASNVHVYVLDTGLRLSHTEFSGRVSAGYTAVADGWQLSDCHGHGTHVTGTVAGTTYGVAKGVIIHPVRVLDCYGYGSFSQVIAGVDWVTANSHLKPAVANMSLRGGGNTSLDAAVRNSIAAGITYVVAAGNDNSNACNYSPARVAEAITVGNSDSSDARYWDSNFGGCLDLFAPGTSILSAYNTSDTAAAYLTGTSMASPHVAGVAALYLANNPTASPATVANVLVSKSTKNVLWNIGVGSPNRLVYSRFDVDDPPTASFYWYCSGLNCTFYDSSFDDNGIVAWSWNFGDGTGGSGSVVNKTFPYDGTFLVTLTVTDTAGQTGQSSQYVSVSSDPCGGDPCCGDPCCGDPCCGGCCGPYICP